MHLMYLIRKKNCNPRRNLLSVVTACWWPFNGIMARGLSGLKHNTVVTDNMKKAPPRETQTLRAGRSKAEPKMFTLPQTPSRGRMDGQNLISWRWSLSLPTNPVWWGSMHTISRYRGNRPTNTHKHTPPARPLQTRTQTGPITIHCAPKLSAQCKR